MCLYMQPLPNDDDDNDGHEDDDDDDDGDDDGGDDDDGDDDDGYDGTKKTKQSLLRLLPCVRSVSAMRLSPMSQRSQHQKHHHHQDGHHHDHHDDDDDNDDDDDDDANDNDDDDRPLRSSRTGRVLLWLRPLSRIKTLRREKLLLRGRHFHLMMLSAWQR